MVCVIGVNKTGWIGVFVCPVVLTVALDGLPVSPVRGTLVFEPYGEEALNGPPDRS